MYLLKYTIPALFLTSVPANCLRIWDRHSTQQSLLPQSQSQSQFQSQPQPQSHPLENPDCNGSGIADPDRDCNGSGIVNPYPDPPSHGPDKTREGFLFDNPSTDCAYVTQMHIWDAFKSLEKDMSKLFTLIHRNVSFTVMGNHPIAGHYADLMHFYVNALRRVSVLFLDHAEKFEIHPRAIHGGCGSRWSVAEVNFRGVMNSGTLFSFLSSLFFLSFLFFSLYL